MINASGNCNFAYVTGLRTYLDCPEQAMADLLTVPKSSYYWSSPAQADKSKPTYRAPANGMYLFAQGSEDSIKTNPYAHTFMAFIEFNELGAVFEIPPVANPAHNNKPGILFVWAIDHAACKAWWKKNVLDVATKKDKIKDEVQ